MNIERTDRQLRIFFRRSEGSGLIDLWLATRYDADEKYVDAQLSFQERRDAFIWAMHEFLREGRIKLHKNGVFLDSSVEEQVEAFRLAFPASEEEADRQCTKPGYEPAYEGFGMNVWWFLDICPAGVAWRMPDRSYQIAD